jgi:hypothetical protein
MIVLRFSCLGASFVNVTGSELKLCLATSQSGPLTTFATERAMPHLRTLEAARLGAGKTRELDPGGRPGAEPAAASGHLCHFKGKITGV